MGTIIQFPDEFFRYSRDVRPASGEDATIIILPSIRVERHAGPSSECPDDTKSPPRSRRRRGSR